MGHGKGGTGIRMRLGAALAMMAGSAWAGVEWVAPSLEGPDFATGVEISSGDYLLVNQEGGYQRLDAAGQATASGARLCEFRPESLWVSAQGIGVLGTASGQARPGGETWQSIRYLDRSLKPVGSVVDLGARAISTSRGFLALRGAAFGDTAAEYTVLEADAAGKEAWSIKVPRGRGFRVLGLFGMGGGAWVCAQVANEYGADSIAVDRIDGAGKFLGRSAWIVEDLYLDMGTQHSATWIPSPRPGGGLLLSGLRYGNLGDTLSLLSVGPSGALEGRADHPFQTKPGPNSSWGVRSLETLAGGGAWIAFDHTQIVLSRPPVTSTTTRYFRFDASAMALLPEDRPAQEVFPTEPCKSWKTARDGRGNELGLGCLGGQVQPAYMIRPEAGGGAWHPVVLPDYTGHLRFFVPTSDGGGLVGGRLGSLPRAGEPGPTFSVAKLGADYLAPVGLRRGSPRSQASPAAGTPLRTVDVLGRTRPPSASGICTILPVPPKTP